MKGKNAILVAGLAAVGYWYWRENYSFEKADDCLPADAPFNASIDVTVIREIMSPDIPMKLKIPLLALAYVGTFQIRSPLKTFGLMAMSEVSARELGNAAWNQWKEYADIDASIAITLAIQYLEKLDAAGYSVVTNIDAYWVGVPAYAQGYRNPILAYQEYYHRAYCFFQQLTDEQWEAMSKAAAQDLDSVRL